MTHTQTLRRAQTTETSSSSSMKWMECSMCNRWRFDFCHQDQETSRDESRKDLVTVVGFDEAVSEL